jgi:hypothetical protein
MMFETGSTGFDMDMSELRKRSVVDRMATKKIGQKNLNGDSNIVKLASKGNLRLAA